MGNSKYIAKLLGPFLIALTLSEMINPQIWENVPATQTYLAGSLWLIGGLAILRNHNYWLVSWPVIITTVGWFAVLGGLSRMFFPVALQQNTGNHFIVTALQIVLLLTGIVLTIKAYSPYSKSPSAKKM